MSQEQQDVKIIKSPQVRAAARSDIGKRRSENQDAYGFVRAHNYDLFLVADGMGGAKGGATASAIAADVITKCAADESSNITEDSLRYAIERANAIIFHEGRKNDQLTGMGTTVVVVVVCQGKALVAHVGDSRIYRYRQDNLELLTRDHTLVKELIDSGAISPAQAENHPIAHMLTRSLGPTAAVQVDSRLLEEPLVAGDRFLLCCDGLYNLVKEQEIAEYIKNPDLQQIADSLIALANERGGTDNITVQVIEVGGASGTESVDEPKIEDRYVSRTVQYDNSYQYIPGTVPETALDAAIHERMAVFPEKETSFEKKGGPAPKIFEERVEEEAKSQPGKEQDRKDPIVKEDPIDHILGQPEEEPALVGNDAVSDSFHDLEVETEAPKIQAKIHAPLLFGKDRRVMLSIIILAFLFVVTMVCVFIPASKPGKDGMQTVNVEPESTAVPLHQPKIPHQPEDSITQSPDSLPEPEAPQTTSEGGDTPETIAQDSQQPTQQDTQPSSTPEPELNVSPSEELVSQVIPSVPETVVVGTEVVEQGTQAPVEAKEEENQVVDQVIAEASDISVPPPPVVEATSVEEVPDQPIDWTTEERKAAEQAQGGVILSEQEKLQVIKEKSKIRVQISETDMRLQAFNFQSIGDAEKKGAELEQRISDINLAIARTKESIAVSKRRQEVWKERKERYRKEDPLKLAAEIALTSIQVKRKKELYEIASIRYLDAVEVLRENPSDDSLAAQMSSLGRQLEAQRKELKAAIAHSIEKSTEQVIFEMSEFSLVLEDLEAHRARLSRSIGYLKTFTQPIVDGRIEQQQRLFSERRELVEKLKDLRQRVSDDLELEIRRAEIMKEILRKEEVVSPPIPIQ